MEHRKARSLHMSTPKCADYASGSALLASEKIIGAASGGAGFGSRIGQEPNQWRGNTITMNLRCCCDHAPPVVVWPFEKVKALVPLIQPGKVGTFGKLRIANFVEYKNAYTTHSGFVANTRSARR